jgi:hypothetical protein
MPAGAVAANGSGAVPVAASAGFAAGFAAVDGEAPLQLPEGVGLAVIAGLADDVRVAYAASGTSVTMSWKRRAS